MVDLNLPEELLRCPNCKNLLFLTNSELECNTCTKGFFLYNETIPVLINNVDEYIFNSLIRIEQHLHIREMEYAAMKNSKYVASYRGKERIDTIIAACKKNDDLLIELKSKIEQHINTSAFKAFKFKPDKAPTGYTFNLKYLIRDWCQLGHGENEIRSIKDFLMASVNRAESVLFLGGATGRLACEMAEIYEQVVTLDFSFTYTYLFNLIRRQDISFYEENFKNIATVNDIVVHRNASSDFIPSKQKQKIINVLANVANLPFADGTFSMLYSIYFSDIIPFGQVITEAKRVLRKGGRFIHYGPLEFHFKQFHLIQSIEELKLSIQQSGFKILRMEQFIAEHCRSEIALSYKVYTVWGIVAEKL